MKPIDDGERGIANLLVAVEILRHQPKCIRIARAATLFCKSPVVTHSGCSSTVKDWLTSRRALSGGRHVLERELLPM
jgi:hypothetical protein